MKGVVVLGMHRSGTSALTRVVNLLGAAVPAPEDLLTDFDNPDGHWESRSLVALNDRILGLFGRSWDFPPRLAEGWERTPRAEAMLPELADAFDAIFPETPWAWKDPRTCLTLPLWRRVLGEDLCVLLVLRSAAAVAQSIHRRDRIPRLYAAGLWLRYLAGAVGGAAGLPTLCVHFEEFLDDPPAATAALSAQLSALGLALPGDVEEAAASLHPGGRPPEAAAAGVDRLVERVTAGGAALSASLSGPSAPFAPPPIGVPAWVRPAHFVYRAQWALRARAGHPLVRFPPPEVPAGAP